jgi:hypothetical protein
VTSTNLQTEFLLQFRKQQEDSAILLAGNRPQQQRQDKRNKERQKGTRKTKGKDKQGKTKNKWAQEARHLQDLKQNHSENAKSGNSKQEFFFKKQPSSSL